MTWWRNSKQELVSLFCILPKRAALLICVMGCTKRHMSFRRYPNMDFLVREVRAVTTGPLRIVRLGSCAGLRPDLPVGTVAVASEGSLFISQNPDAWAAAGTVSIEPDESSCASREPYVFHGVAQADEELSNVLLQELKRSLGKEVVGCLNASADSFYSSQGERRSGLYVTPDHASPVRSLRFAPDGVGYARRMSKVAGKSSWVQRQSSTISRLSARFTGRLDSSFEDRNEDLVQSLLARHPTVGSFEMETFQLLHLARLCRKSTVHASAASIVVRGRIPPLLCNPTDFVRKRRISAVPQRRRV